MARSGVALLALVTIALAGVKGQNSVLSTLQTLPSPGCDGYWRSNNNASYVASVYAGQGYCIYAGATIATVGGKSFCGVMAMRPGAPLIWDTYVSDGNYTAVFQAGSSPAQQYPSLQLHAFGDDQGTGTVNYTWYRQPPPALRKGVQNYTDLSGWYEGDHDARMTCLASSTTGGVHLCVMISTAWGGVTSATMTVIERTDGNGFDAYTNMGQLRVFRDFKGTGLSFYDARLIPANSQPTADAIVAVVLTPAPLPGHAPSGAGLYRQQLSDVWLVTGCGSPAKAPGATLCLAAGTNTTSGKPEHIAGVEKFASTGYKSDFYTQDGNYTTFMTSPSGAIKAFQQWGYTNAYPSAAFASCPGAAYLTCPGSPVATLIKVPYLQTLAGSWYSSNTTSQFTCLGDEQFATCTGVSFEDSITASFSIAASAQGYGVWRYLVSSNAAGGGVGVDSAVAVVSIDGFQLKLYRGDGSTPFVADRIA